MANAEPGGRPHCRDCGVDMWLMRVDASERAGRHSYHFECKVCGRETILAVEDADVCRVENGL